MSTPSAAAVFKNSKKPLQAPGLSRPAQEGTDGEFTLLNVSDYLKRRSFERDPALVQASQAWAACVEPRISKDVTVLSCCDERLGFELAIAHFGDEDSVSIFDPALLQDSLGTLGDWLPRLLTLLASQAERPCVINLRNLGASTREWASAAPRFMAQHRLTSNCILLVEYVSAVAANWSEGLDIPFPVLKVEDEDVVLRYLDIRGLPKRFEKPDLGLAQSLRDQVLQDDRWRFHQANGWKAVLRVAMQSARKYESRLGRYAEEHFQGIDPSRGNEDGLLQLFIDPDPRCAVALLVAVYFNELSVGAYLQICDSVLAVAPLEPANPRARTRARSPRLIDDQVMTRCGLQFTSLTRQDAARIEFRDGADDLSTSVIERHASVARGRLLQRLSAIALIASADEALRAGMRNLMLAVVGTETTQVSEMVERLADLVTAPSRFASPQTPALSRDVRERLVDLPAVMPDAVRHLLGASPTNEAFREKLMSLLAPRLWSAATLPGAVATQDWDLVENVATRAIAELLGSGLLTRMQSLLPPDSVALSPLRAATFLFYLFEEDLIKGRQPTRMPPDQALQIAIRIEADILATGSLTTRPLTVQRFVASLFVRSLIQNVFVGLWKYGRDRGYVRSELKRVLWPGAGPEKAAGGDAAGGPAPGLLTLRALTQLLLWHREDAVNPLALFSGTDYAPGGRVWLFYLLAEWLTNAFDCGYMRDAFLAFCLTRTADFTANPPPDLLDWGIIWNVSTPDPEREGNGWLARFDSIMDGLLRALPIVLLMEILPRPGDHISSAAAIFESLADSGVDCTPWDACAAESEPVLQRFLAEARELLRTARLSNAARESMLSVILDHQQRLRDARFAIRHAVARTTAI